MATAFQANAFQANAFQVDAVTPFVSSGRRVGTSYAYKTLTELREEERQRELIRLKKKPAVKKALKAELLSEEALARALLDLSAAELAFMPFADVLVRFYEAQRLIEIEADEDDAIALLLAA